MGRTPLPLVIGIVGMDYHHPVLAKLAAQGHTIRIVEAGEDYDLIIGPKCWRTLPDLKYLDVTLGQARKLKREAVE